MPTRFLLQRALALLLLLAPFLTTVRLSAEGPNIIFILLDDAGYGDIGSFYQKQRELAGNRAEPWHYTPELDKLADQGLKMFQHYCPAPICGASRSSLLQGVHQGHSNIRNAQHGKAIEDNWTLPRVLKEAGYATAMMGKHGLEGTGTTAADYTGYPTRRGFDYYFGQVTHDDGHNHYPAHPYFSPYTGQLVESKKQFWDNNTEISDDLTLCYTTDLYIARAKKWIADHTAAAPAQPFFLYLPLDTPHAAFQIPTQAYPAGGGLTGGMQWIGEPGNMINTASGTIDSYLHPDYANATWDHDGNAATAEEPWPDVYKRFAGMMRRIDDGVGDLMQTLIDLGIDENTLIIFTSDNGPTGTSYLQESPSYKREFFDNAGPLRGAKFSVWEGGLRIPTLAWWPGTIAPGRADHNPSQFHDWMPTFAELAGLPVPARTDGVSLVPTLTETGTQAASTIYSEYQDQQMILLDGYKGVRFDLTSATEPFRIYDLDNDIGESNNLAFDPGMEVIQQAMRDAIPRLRRVDPEAPRPYDTESAPPITDTPTIPGVEWRVFEREYSYLPDLKVEAETGSGTAAAPSVSLLTREDNIALQVSGYLNIPTEGEWTFSLTTDAGAFLRIHQASVIDAGYGYLSGLEKSGSIRLQPGLHPFTLYYYRGTQGSPFLDLMWNGPGVTAEPIPDSVFFRQGVQAGPPSVSDDMIESLMGETVFIDVLANDQDDGTPEPLQIDAVEAPQSGSVRVVGGQVEYTPDPDFLGTDTFRYRVTDGASAVWGRVTVDVIYFDPTEIWLTFDQMEDEWVYEAGGSRLGILYGHDNPGDAQVDGWIRTGLDFDGQDDRVILDQNVFAPPVGASARTVTAWVKASPGDPGGAIVAWGAIGSKKCQILLEPRSPNTGALHVEGAASLLGTQDLRANQWHHIAFTISDQGTARIYVDGVVAGEGSSNAATELAPVYIGSDTQDRYFTGQIDEVRIYHRELSASEIAAQANATASIEEAWLRRNLGNRAVDWSENTDGDAFNLIAELAFGGSPYKADPPVVPGLAIENGQPTLRFVGVDPAISNLAYNFEFSRTLQPDSWLPCSGTRSLEESTGIQSPDRLSSHVFRVDTPDLLEEPRAFFRIAVDRVVP